MVREIIQNNETLYVISIPSALWHDYPERINFLKETRTRNLKVLEDWGRWFGDPHDRYNTLYIDDRQSTDIWFKDPKHAVWFALRWC